MATQKSDASTTKRLNQDELNTPGPSPQTMGNLPISSASLYTVAKAEKWCGGRGWPQKARKAKKTAK